MPEGYNLESLRQYCETGTGKPIQAIGQLLHRRG